jgi:AraC-like DNA-binding protein
MKGIGAMSVVTARPVIRALEDRGVDAERVLAAARLSRQALGSFDNRLPHDQVRTLWEAAASACRDGAFGVHVAEALPAGAYDLFDYLLATAATLGDSVARLARHVRLLHDHTRLHVIVEPRSARVIASAPVTAPQYDEFWLTLLVQRTRRATGVHWLPDGASVQHERASDDGELARALGCAVTFGAPQTELRLRRPVLQLPNLTADAPLAAILERYATALQDGLPPDETLVARGSSAIARQITRQLPTLAATARSLGQPTRTLQRRLSAHGVTHSGLVDEVRRALALKSIGDAGVAITEIAYRLHFADPAAFYRAFKRWTGLSPRAYRARLLSGNER